LARQRANLARQEEERQSVDQSIVQSLYSLEVKLKVGQDRSKNWKDQNLKGKAQNFNKRVDEIKSINMSSGAGSAEQLELERMNKVVQK